MSATVGIDLASQAAGTAVCAIEWDGQPTVAALMRGVIDETSKTPLDDKMIASVMRTDHGAVPADVTKIAIDAPFGWPSAFVDALAGRGPWPGAGAGVNPALTRRRTDHWISRVARKTPLSVSTDRIAYPAMRLAGLFQHLAEMQPDTVVDRTGRTGRFCEAYPDPAIRAFGLWPDGVKTRASYKRARGARIRREIMDQLHAKAPWLAITSAQIEACVASDDLLDSLICALVARAVESTEYVHKIPVEDEHDAEREGWIQLPMNGALDALR
jgi:predicted RNase H-like nuclease